MHEDIHPKMASYIGNNELRMNMLRNWDIYYEQERDLWNCRHWHNKDSIKTFVQVQTDVLNNIKYSNYLISNEDSINSLHTALQNIQTLNYYCSKETLSLSANRCMENGILESYTDNIVC